MDLIPVYGIYQDSSALYVAAVTTSFMDVYPSCDLCRHGFRLCTKVMSLSALAFCSAYADSQGQLRSEVVYNVKSLKPLVHVHLDKASYCMHLLQIRV